MLTLALLLILGVVSGNKPVVIVVHEDQVMGTIVAPESEEMLYSFLLRHAKLVPSLAVSLFIMVYDVSFTVLPWVG